MIKDKHFLVVWIAVLALTLGLSLFASAGLAQDSGEPPAESQPASEAVAPAPPNALTRAYLPFIGRKKIESTLPFTDKFDAGWPANWTVFTNYPGLEADDWAWYPWSSSSGFLSYEPDDWKGFALLMYLGPGHASWSDYQVVTSIRPTGDRLAGLWLRGEYVPQTDGQGGWVGGYYLHLRPDDETVYLWRIQPQAHQFHVADVVSSAVYGPGIQRGKWYHLKAQVRGANIKAWLKLKSDPDSAYQQVINWTDPANAYANGTVGFSTFRTTALFDDIEVKALPALGQ